MNSNVAHPSYEELCQINKSQQQKIKSLEGLLCLQKSLTKQNAEHLTTMANQMMLDSGNKLLKDFEKKLRSQEVFMEEICEKLKAQCLSDVEAFKVSQFL